MRTKAFWDERRTANLQELELLRLANGEIMREISYLAADLLRYSTAARKDRRSAERRKKFKDKILFHKRRLAKNNRKTRKVLAKVAYYEERLQVPVKTIYERMDSLGGNPLPERRVTGSDVPA